MILTTTYSNICNEYKKLKKENRQLKHKSKIERKRIVDNIKNNLDVETKTDRGDTDQSVCSSIETSEEISLYDSE